MAIEFGEYRNRIFNLLSNRPEMTLVEVKDVVDSMLEILGIDEYYREINCNGTMRTKYYKIK